MKYFLVAVVLMLNLVAVTHVTAGQGRSSYPGEFDADTPWQEAASELPAAPTTATMRPIYVSAVATNNYFVDETTLTFGSDRVVRYVLVVEAAGGARTVSFEGMHCDTGRWKLYATGRPDGTWARARVSEWREIENKTVNRHHAALSRDYFCPSGGSLRNADDGRNALKRGKHPEAS